MALAGPLDPGPVTEHEGPLGFIWTWTVQPQVEGFYQWTFFADGLRPCITSGFNAYAPVGATATPTNTAVPTNTPGPTSTPTPTVVAAPTISSVAPTSVACGASVITIIGSNFGTPPSSFGTAAFLLTSGVSFQLTQIGTGSNTQLRVTMPTSGPKNGPGQIQVSNAGGDSGLIPVTVSGC
jgi:hypothetical protein